MSLVVPAFIRGETVVDNLISFDGRGSQATFLAPDPMSIIDRLPLRDPGGLSDLEVLSVDEIIDFLAALGRCLVLSDNEFLQEALEQSAQWSDMSEPVLRASYEQLPNAFEPALLREMADTAIGLRYLDGWSSQTLLDGRVASVRATGARCLHIIAGNSPLVAALSLVRSALTRGDAVIKTPSNDPLTALALARSMASLAPDHPITRHVAVAYWKGGSVDIEEQLYRPAHLDKIVAWGGLSSVRHVTRYIQPGLELISLDPKRSGTIIGAAAFENEETLTEVARRAAVDVGAMNQLGCVCARVIYVECGLEPSDLRRLDHFGELIYQEIQRLPPSISTKARRFDPELRANLHALRFSSDWYCVIGGGDDEGAVVVSHLDEPVDFYPSLSGRVANVVPVVDPIHAARRMNSYTQTVGIWPESLKQELRDVLPRYGVQRLVSLGYAVSAHPGLPQDAIEPARRMAKWIVDERCDVDVVAPPWKAARGVGFGAPANR
jgi:hypothetical protein